MERGGQGLQGGFGDFDFTQMRMLDYNVGFRLPYQSSSQFVSIFQDQFQSLGRPVG